MHPPPDDGRDGQTETKEYWLAESTKQGRLSRKRADSEIGSQGSEYAIGREEEIVAS